MLILSELEGQTNVGPKLNLLVWVPSCWKYKAALKPVSSAEQLGCFCYQIFGSRVTANNGLNPKMCGYKYCITCYCNTS